MFCHGCGSFCEDSWQFCSSCGSKISLSSGPTDLTSSTNLIRRPPRPISTSGGNNEATNANATSTFTASSSAAPSVSQLTRPKSFEEFLKDRKNNSGFQQTGIKKKKGKVSTKGKAEKVKVDKSFFYLGTYKFSKLSVQIQSLCQKIINTLPLILFY